VRDYDSHYGYADSVNRRARWGVAIVLVLVFGLAYASSAIGGGDTPPVSVLSLGVTGSAPATLVVTPTTSTSLADGTEAAPSIDDANPTALRTTKTSQLPPSTTSTTRPRATITTTQPATTTTTIPPTPTTTVPPTTTTTSTSTTTTTLPPIVGTVHIHDLKGDDKGDDDEPYAKIEVQVRNDESRNQGGVLVVGRFSAGDLRQVSAITNNKGKVTFESGIVGSDSVTFTVVDLVLEDYAYAPEDNRRGPSVNVEFD
jgi:hypothetical protein